jgi:hypothetical protein
VLGELVAEWHAAHAEPEFGLEDLLGTAGHGWVPIY